MSVKIKETACMSELKETKQKVMEFETQVTNMICMVYLETVVLYNFKNRQNGLHFVVTPFTSEMGGGGAFQCGLKHHINST